MLYVEVFIECMNKLNNENLINGLNWCYFKLYLNLMYTMYINHIKINILKLLAVCSENLYFIFKDKNTL